MKKIIMIIILLIISLLITFLFIFKDKDNKDEFNGGDKFMYIKINDKVLKATLEDNSSAEALIEKLNEKDLVVDMEDYGNFEKVGNLGFSLPTNDKNITTVPGDIILYEGNKITIYYDKNTWNFTHLGRIEGITSNELKTILGDGDVSVTFSIKEN